MDRNGSKKRLDRLPEEIGQVLAAKALEPGSPEAQAAELANAKLVLEQEQVVRANRVVAKIEALLREERCEIKLFLTMDSTNKVQWTYRVEAL